MNWRTLFLRLQGGRGAKGGNLYKPSAKLYLKSTLASFTGKIMIPFCIFFPWKSKLNVKNDKLRREYETYQRAMNVSKEISVVFWREGASPLALNPYFTGKNFFSHQFHALSPYFKAVLLSGKNQFHGQNFWNFAEFLTFRKGFSCLFPLALIWFSPMWFTEIFTVKIDLHAQFWGFSWVFSRAKIDKIQEFSRESFCF